MNTQLYASHLKIWLNARVLLNLSMCIAADVSIRIADVQMDINNPAPAYRNIIACVPVGHISGKRMGTQQDKTAITPKM